LRHRYKIDIIGVQPSIDAYLRTRRFHAHHDERIFNFSAGPATLPLEVLEQIKTDLPITKVPACLSWK